MSETRDTDPVMYGGRLLPRVIAEALRFYGRAEHYAAEGPEHCPVRADGGARARAALAASSPSVIHPAVETALRAASFADTFAPNRFDPVPAVYTNHAGLTQVRQIVPVALGYDSPYHPGEHTLYGLDAVKGAYREFALSGFRAWGQGAVDERTEHLLAMGRAMDALAVLADANETAMTAYQILADAGATPAEEVRS